MNELELRIVSAFETIASALTRIAAAMEKRGPGEEEDDEEDDDAAQALRSSERRAYRGAA